jgi:hypothetical protein
MNILLLGGSNTGMRDGWAAHFERLAAEHRVANRFLGAVGSLHGLMRLLKMRQDNEPAPDLIIFEYTLNDILLVNADCLNAAMLADTLREVANFCARANIRLLFLCLEPRYPKPPGAFGRTARARRLYARAAKAHAMTPCVWLNGILGAAPGSECYQDENHLTAGVSLRVAEYMLSLIRERPPAVPRPRGGMRCAFDYIDATQARTQGPCRLARLQSPVFEGPFVEIARSGASFWPGRGELAGLMLRSLDASGVYLIRAGAQAFRKNAHSHMLQTVRKLMLLHYSTRRISVDDDLEVSMPADGAWLMALPEDVTPLESPSPTPFDAQILEIHGVMLWRGTFAREAWAMPRRWWRVPAA